MAEELAAAHPDSIRVLRLLRDIQSKQGELSAQARTLHRIQALDESPETLRGERCSWAGSSRRPPAGCRGSRARRGRSQPVDGVVLHLLKESLPYLTNGFTMRSRYNLLAVRDAGLEPARRDEPRLPATARRFGPSPSRPSSWSTGSPITGSTWARSTPPTARSTSILEDQAWLTARIARQVRAGDHPRRRPATAATSRPSSGAALRDHIDLPLVYEVRSFFESTWRPTRAGTSAASSTAAGTTPRPRRCAPPTTSSTIAEAMRDDIVARGVDPDRVTVIPNGVDPRSSPRSRPTRRCARRYGLDGRFPFGYVSNLDHPREGQEPSSRRPRSSSSRGRDVTCLIIGDGKRRAEIEAIARKAGVADRVVFTGRVPHDAVAGHYALLDAFVVPRRDERAARPVTPLKPYEAMAMARPLVVADLPALTEIAAPDERGLAVPGRRRGGPRRRRSSG